MRKALQATALDFSQDGRDALPHEAEHLLESARQSFTLAGNSTSASDMERHAAIGRAYLERAHAAACIDEHKPATRD